MQHVECSVIWCQNFGHFIKKIRNTLKVLKPGAGEGWRSFGPICVKNELVLYRVKENRNILHTIKRRKANWIGHIWHRNCLLKHIIEGRIQVMGR